MLHLIVGVIWSLFWFWLLPVPVMLFLDRVLLGGSERRFPLTHAYISILTTAARALFGGAARLLAALLSRR